MNTRSRASCCRLPSGVFENVIGFYGRTLTFVLQYQRATLLVALGTLALTVLLYILIPKGFFPVQDTGVIQGISQASPTIGFKAMAQKQQQLAKLILTDPGVESLSSFIGADWHEHDCQQRPHVDQPQAARHAPRQCPRPSSAGWRRNWRRWRVSSCSWSRCRTSPWTTG